MSYFVSLKDPKTLRRELLESSKLVIYGLKNYQQVRHLREKKIEAVGQLRTEVKELLLLVDKLENLLPEHVIRNAPVRAKNKAKEEPKEEPHEVLTTAPEHQTELDRLEQALSHVENKLRLLEPKA